MARIDKKETVILIHWQKHIHCAVIKHKSGIRHLVEINKTNEVQETFI